jgi:hypothetical protein
MHSSSSRFGFFKKIINLNLKLIKYTKNKQKNPICDLHTLLKKLNEKIIFVTTIFGGLSVLMLFLKSKQTHILHN